MANIGKIFASRACGLAKAANYSNNVRFYCCGKFNCHGNMM